MNYPDNYSPACSDGRSFFFFFNSFFTGFFILFFLSFCRCIRTPRIVWRFNYTAITAGVIRVLSRAQPLWHCVRVHITAHADRKERITTTAITITRSLLPSGRPPPPNPVPKHEKTKPSNDSKNSDKRRRFFFFLVVPNWVKDLRNRQRPGFPAPVGYRHAIFVARPESENNRTTSAAKPTRRAEM